MRHIGGVLGVLALVTLSVTALRTTTVNAENPLPAGGASIGDFALKDVQGAAYFLADFKDARVVVVAFIGVECPLAKLYAPRLSELARSYADRGVKFLAVDANAQDSLAEMENFSRTQQLTIPFLKDPGNVVADRFSAERTPEVFVLDRERVVRYRGRIDDQYGFQSGVGYQRPKATKHDLADAIDQLLADQIVTQPVTRAPGCLIGRTRAANEQSETTYSNQIARIFQEHCVRCHREREIAPFSLTSYDEAVGWALMIDEVVRDNRMPPWHADPAVGHFANDCRLSDKEKQLISNWVANGAPRGNSSDLPSPATFTSGWQITQPDRVIPMSDRPFTVPAEGKIEYQYFVADPGFEEDKWVREAEARPGNNAVVHHIIVFIVPPGQNARRMGEGIGGGNLLVGTAPGNPPAVFAPGMGKRIRAGSKLLFQMHYTANGSEQPDMSSVGLVFADPATITREVKTDLAINAGFRVPPGANNHMVEAWRTFNEDTLLLSLMPHMHLRGKSFLYELQYPDGTTEALLSISRYDFNWQNNYELDQPKRVPRGTKLHCVAHFDNSEENLANPDSTQSVSWGEQTWEEMMIGFFTRATLEEKPQLAIQLSEKDVARARPLQSQ